MNTKIIDFKDIVNFRELGGYIAKDGRQVKEGQFYRSARLTGLCEEEREKFLSLGIKVILDFRSKGEINQYKDPEFSGIENKAISAILEMDGNEKDFDPEHLFKQTPEEMKQDELDFMEIYKAMPFGNKAYVYMFECMLTEKMPILFHCTAGKDRTGIAAALIFMALGVERKVIEEDYMVTNICCADNIEKIVTKHYKDGDPEYVKHYLSGIGGVCLHNLTAAIDEIEKRYATYEDFLLNEYNLDTAKLDKLKSMYLA